MMLFRRTTLSLLGAFCALGGLCAAGALAQDPSAITLKTTQLTDTLHMVEPFPPMAGNLLVSAGDDGILLIDDQMMEVTEKIKAEIAKIQKGDVDYLINTHWHFDHAGGNAAFGLKSAILAHENVRERLKVGNPDAAQFPTPPAPPEAWPVLTFKDSVTLHWNGEAIDVIHFPSGHTDGDSVVFFRESNVVHMGDHFFNTGGYPFADLGSGGNAVGLKDNVAKVLELVDDNTKIIPGHGPLASKADLQRFHDLLDETIGLISKAKSGGQSMPDFIKAGLPEKFASHGKASFIPEAGWIQFVWSSLP